MKTLCKWLISALTILAAMNVHAGQNSIDQDAIVKETINAWMQKNNIPGVAVEIYTNGVPRSYNFGMADPKNQIPVSNKTIFELGSITKIFTSLLMAESVNNGKKQLNSPISKYVPDLFSSNTKITLLNLATHTAGLPFNVPDEINSRGKLENYFSHWKPAFAPNTQWAYSNVGIGLMGFSLETATHRSMDQLFRGDILGPLHMQEIGLQVPKSQMKYYAQGFSNREDAVMTKVQNGLFPAAWGMKASAHDMLQFLKAALNLPGTPMEIGKAMLMTETPYFQLNGLKQGLVWTINPISWENIASLLNPPANFNLGPIPAKPIDKNGQKFNGNTLIDKTGATNGFHSYIGLIPKRKSGIVILANRNVSNGEIVKTGRIILFKLNNLS